MTNRNDDPNAYNKTIIDEFRANNGTVPSRPGQQILLLHTVGAKSGLPRTNPVSYLEGDGCLYVFATKGGSPQHPDWYLNLTAHPNVSIEVGPETYEAAATTVPAPDRDRIYAEMVQARPHFGDYETKTTRVIPVVALHRT